MPKLNGKIILCDSNINWDYNRYSKHHLMAQFAKSNRVFFVNPQVDCFEYFRRNRFGFFRRTREEEDLCVFDSLALPFRAESSLIRKFDQDCFSLQLKGLLKGVAEQDLILFMGNPGKVFLLEKFKNYACSIYHCSDNLSALFEGGLKQKILEAEQEILSRVDLVIAASEKLLEKCKKVNANSYLVENGVDERFYCTENETVPLPRDLQEKGSPRIGYVGCIDKKIDFELLEFVLGEHRDKSFVFIGPVHPESENVFFALKKYSNFLYLGSKPWQTLPKYVKNFDLCLIPWGLNDFTKYTSPLKLREYVVAGKIVVGTEIPVSEGLRPAVRIGATKQEFSALINSALAETNASKDQIQISISGLGLSWKNKTEEISELIEKCLQKR